MSIAHEAAVRDAARLSNPSKPLEGLPRHLTAQRVAAQLRNELQTAVMTLDIAEAAGGRVDREDLEELRGVIERVHRIANALDGRADA